MNHRIYAILSKIENNPVILSVNRGFILMIPILMSGSLALLIRSFPIPAFQEFLSVLAYGGILYLLNCIYDVTFGFISLYLLLSISYYYASTLQPNNIFLQMLSMIVSLACFVASFGGMAESFTITHFSAIGVFPAMICSIVGTKLFYFFSNLLSKWTQFNIAGMDINYKGGIFTILPVFICIVIFLLIHKGIYLIFSVDNFNDLISGIFVKLFQNLQGNLASGIFYVFVLNFLWFFGIHGGNALEQVSQAVLVPANLDPSSIISKSFLDNFALLGGCGGTVCMVIAMLLCAKTNNNKQLARSAAPAVLFNINEILVFGFPIVLNPVLLIPFITVPILSLIIAYISTIIGILPIVVKTVSWTTPILFSGYIATGSVWGILVQFFIVAAGTAIYIPFIRLSEQLQLNREQILIDELTKKFQENEQSGTAEYYLNRQDQWGSIAKTMVNKLYNDIVEKNIPIFYQPQLDRSGAIIGAEALLRWRFKGKVVYPPLIISLAKENDLYSALTSCILEQILSDISTIQAETGESKLISMNITAEQLNSTSFIHMVIDMVQKKEAENCFCMEVTEETSLVYYDNISTNIAVLNKNGIPMAIDDFSMGRTSLKYLQYNNFHYVKLDGELVRQVIDNTRCQEIIHSIVSLGENLHFKIIAEYVENKAIEEVLLSLNCDYFQGYLYSPALPLAEFIAYCQQAENVLHQV